MSWQRLDTLLMLMLAYGTAGQPHTAISTANELYAALGNQNVTDIELTDDIDLKYSAFNGTSNALDILRSVRIYGQEGLWPTWNHRFLANRVLAASGVTITVEALLLKRAMGDSLVLAFGFFGMKNGSRLLIKNALLHTYSCVDYNIFSTFLASFPRPASSPGEQFMRAGEPGGWCYPPSSRKSGCMTPGHTAVDFQTEIALDPGSPAGRGAYTMQFDSLGYVCVADVPQECMQRDGVRKCMTTIGNALIQVEDAEEARQEAQGASKGGGSDGSDQWLVIILPSVLGGLAVAAVAMGGAVLLRRRRRQRCSLSETVKGASPRSLSGAPKEEGATKDGDMACRSSPGEGHSSSCLTGIYVGAMPPDDQPTTLQASAAGRQQPSEPPTAQAAAQLRPAPAMPQGLGKDAQRSYGPMFPGYPFQPQRASNVSAGGGPPPVQCTLAGNSSSGAARCSLSGPNSSSATSDMALVTVVTAATPMGVRMDLTFQDIDLDGFRIIGSGSFGNILECQFQGQPAALKVIHPTVLDSPGEFEAFQHEATILARCSHPNIVRLLGACVAMPQPFLVQELMACSLKDVIYDEKHALDLAQMLGIARDVALGLSYLHPTILHRDLKPGNVLMTSRVNGMAKISDFNLARLKESTLVTASIESGTASYMAPECFQPDNYRLTPACDIYSLGVVMCEMLTRQAPWKGVRPVVVGMQVSIQNNRPTLPHDEERCPPRLRRLIESCWTSQPEQRPSAVTVAKELTLITAALERSRAGSTSGAAAGRSSGPGARPGLAADVISASCGPSSAALVGAAAVAAAGAGTKPQWS